MHGQTYRLSITHEEIGINWIYLYITGYDPVRVDGVVRLGRGHIDGNAVYIAVR